ncbi:MAG: hypothetical protein ACKO2G_00450 [Verrucomicrobiales bacterium]
MMIDQDSVIALDLQWRAELRDMTEADALVAADRLLAMSVDAQYPAEKECSLGLIELQSILYGSRQ